MVTMTAAQFNRAPSAVKRQVLAPDTPVLVTDRDAPSLVVMKDADYVRLTGQSLGTDLADWLEPGCDIDFEPALRRPPGSHHQPGISVVRTSRPIQLRPRSPLSGILSAGGPS